MSITLSKVLSLAESELGYIEKATAENLYSKTGNAGTKNFTKYAHELDKINYYNGNKNGYPWCCVFIDWLFVTAGNSAEAARTATNASTKYGAGVKWQWEHYNRVGRTTKTPAVGALVVFKGYAHIGIIESMTTTHYTTIEGNTNVDGATVGDRVARHTYPISLDVEGFCLPTYDEEPFIGDVSECHRQAALWAVNAGLFVGDGGNNFHWHDNITREETATLFRRFYDTLKEGV